jgi:hypothetical protein
MRILTHLAVLVAGIALAYFAVSQRLTDIPRDQALLELLHARAAVEKGLDDQSSRLSRQLEAFGEFVANDRDLAIKLIVERDRSAPEVSRIASRYMAAMDLDLLEVADSAYTLLSSGHFPASAGNSVAEKAAQITPQAAFVYDNVKGQEMLTLQARFDFAVGGEARLTCMGGFIVDSSFVSHLSPRDGLRLLFRAGDLTVGMDSIEAMSGMSDNTIIINDTTYLGTKLRLRYAGEGDAPELMLIAAQPPRVSLF